MSRQTMSFALPESMRECIDNRLSTGNYGNTSEYSSDTDILSWRYRLGDVSTNAIATCDLIENAR